MAGIFTSFGAVYLATVLMQLGATLLITCLALRLSAAGTDEFWVGALMAANALGMVCGGGAGRVLIARLGHIRAYVASGGAIAAAVLGHELSAALPFWLLLRALAGMAMMCQLMVLESWLNDRAESSQRGKVFGTYMAATYAGMMLGQLAVGVDDEAGNLALPAVVVAFALSLVPIALTRNAPPRARAAAPAAVGRLLRGLPQPLLTVLVSGMLNGSFFGLAAVFAAQQGMDTATVGLYLALTVVAGLLAQLPLGLLSDRLPRAGLIRGVAVSLAFACLPLGMHDGWSHKALLAFAFAIGSLQFCLYPLGAALANERIEPVMRVPLAGMLLTVFGIGSCLGPLVAGALMTWAGASSLYLFFAACAAVLALCMGQARAVGAGAGQEAAPRRKVGG